MGFHKRWINKENVTRYYEREGIEGLKVLFSADALIVSGDVDTDRIVEYLTNEDDESLKKLIKEMNDPFDDPDVQDFLEKADEQGPWNEEDDKIHTVGGLTNDKESGFMDFQNKMDQNDSEKEVE